jgi:cellulose biosynthesis protein BcsQ
VRVIALFSAKGGVGKTTLAVALAHAAATRSGRRTLLWDLDPQGAAGWMLGVAPRDGDKARKRLAAADLAALIQPTAWPGLDVLAADRSLRRLEATLADDGSDKAVRRALKPLEARYDRIIIDCPPGLTELADHVFRAADLLVVPVIPSALSARTLTQLEGHLAAEMKAPPPLLPVFSMADRRKALHRTALDSAPDWPVVPSAAAIEAMAERRDPVPPTRAAAVALAGLWAAIERQLATPA